MSTESKTPHLEGKTTLTLDDDQVATGQTTSYRTSIAVAQWARYCPGPSPQHRFRGISPAFSQGGVILIGCCIFLLSGYNLALMGSVSALPSYLQVVDLDDGTQYTQLLIGTINGIYWIGVMCGALIVGWFSERVGRRKAVVFWGIFGLVIVPLFVSLQSFAWALVLRFFNGFFTGAFDSVGLNWSAESVDARHRGRAIGLQLCCAASGASISYFIVYGLSKSASSDIIWRLPLAFQLIFALFILSMVYFLPESPRWLARVGLIEEAKDVLRAMKSGANAEERYAAADADLVSILEAIRLEVDSDSSATYWQMFTARDKLHTSRRTWSALFVQFGVQAMAGVGVVSGYGVKIFETGGWSTETAALLSGFGIITQAAFGIPGALWADRIGRRRAMVYGAIVGSILLALIGICGHYVHLDAHTNPRRAKSYGAATVALVECPFVYPSEIFTASTRAKGSSIGIIGLASGSFFINMVSPYLFAAIGYKSMFLFCGLSFILGIICHLWMPETARKTLEEIDHLYD